MLSLLFHFKLMLYIVCHNVPHLTVKFCYLKNLKKSISAMLNGKRNEIWKGNFLLHMGQSHANLKYSDPILNRISIQLLDNAHHNINKKCNYKQNSNFWWVILENIALYVTFCDDIGHSLYILDYVRSQIFLCLCGNNFPRFYYFLLF